MNRAIRSGLFCILVCIAVGCSQNSRTYTSQNGEFSYVPPEHWIVREIPGLKYKAAIGQPSGGFAPNINVVEEDAPVPLDSYVADSLRTVQQMHEKAGSTPPVVLGQTDITTDARQRGIKLVTQVEINGKQVRQIYYFFEGGSGKKFVVTCSTLAEGGESYDKVFDASMKTFRAGGA